MALAGGGIAGVGVAFGSAFAHNAIGNGTAGETAPGEVKAYISNTAINASGALTVQTTTSETIDAQVGTVAAAISGGFVGVSVSAGVTTSRNDIGLAIDAYIDGDTASGATQTGITAANITISSGDTSNITAEVDTTSIAAAFGAVAVGGSVGVSLATNEISNNMEVYIANAGDGVTASSSFVSVSALESATITAEASASSLALSGGAVGVSISGGGAEATNIILDDTNAYLSDSAVTAATSVATSATASAIINADILAASVALAGGGFAATASFGASVAENFIGYSFDGLVATADPNQVKAYSIDTSISRPAASSAWETASDTSTINTNVAALSVAVTAAVVGDSLSGAGASAVNEIAVDAEATFDGDGRQRSATPLVAHGIDLEATDGTTISANGRRGLAGRHFRIGRRRLGRHFDRKQRHRQ